MIDIKFLRENPDIVKENIKKKFQDEKLVLVDEVIDLDKKSREAILAGDELRNKSKTLTLLPFGQFVWSWWLKWLDSSTFNAR